MPDALFRSSNGLRSLGPQAVALFRALDEQFLRWAGACGAVEKHYPVLMRVEDLARFDYFRNFPHIAVCGCGIRHDEQQRYATSSDPVSEIPAQNLTAADHVLAPAACYNIYLDYEGAALDTDLKVTTIAQCHRNETHYDGLARLRGFTMREIVCVGSAEGVKRHVLSLKQTVSRFADAIGLPVVVEAASDPFFDRASERAVLSRLFPTKEELQYAGEVAIASFNFHRNFFGERCRITSGGDFAFSGCVAFGVERWIHALVDHFGDAEAAISALGAALPRAA